MKRLLFFIILYSGNLFSQFQNSLISVDYNIGYNMARIESNYFFEEQIPVSFQLNLQKSNFLNKKSLSQYGFSDFGLSFLFHDYKDTELGVNYGLYAFMEYYLTKPVNRLKLSFRLSHGIAYNTKPYNKKNNPKNKFFGTHLLLPIDAFFYLKYPNIFNHWGLQVGLGIFHYSNGNLQSPNYGSNIPSFNFGINYDLSNTKIVTKKIKLHFDKKLHYTALFRTGLNESDYIDSGQFPFFIPGFQLEKSFSYRNKLILGTELFVSYFLKEQIAYEAVSMYEKELDNDTDFKRIGVFAEHEFFYGKFGIDLGIGYYVYYPYHFETRFYNRLGLKYYFSNKFALAYTLKVHGINRAEAFELGLYYRIN